MSSVSEDTVKIVLDQSIDWALSIADLVAEYSEDNTKDSSFKELDDTIKSLCIMDQEFIVSQKIFEKLKDAEDMELSEYSAIKTFVDNTLSKNERKMNPLKHPKYIEFQEKIKEPTDTNDDGGEDLVVTAADVNIIDPYTKSFITDPIKNNICGHHYDKKYVLEALKKKSKLRCPFGGCTAQKFSKENLVVDDKLTQEILKKVAESQRGESSSTENIY